ncbi:TfoX/Sxy family protein [Cellulomonas aerilata]|uniref:RNA methyltransferase n=1 Tax=Cellulomonas aerilata TaxID=515326 RepID=A0A512DB20_9CELL|nr:TfoX/Sxy family protein [Cellulomonas aerilata]GEO33658.1 RNA methyltransferase [Cellulomonas aerilata]
MTARGQGLADRVRALLPADRPVREVRMFGKLSFMVDDALVVAAGRDGDLLVRTDPGRHGELLGVRGAEPAAMGAGRTMGPGWITVTDDGLATDEQIAFWIGVGLQARPR